MLQENRPKTVREAELIRQVAENEQRIKQLQQQVARLKRSDSQPRIPPRLPGGGHERQAYVC